MNDALPTALIYPHPEARSLDRAKVESIAASIAEVGLLNPIIVRKALKYRNGVKADAWEIIAGHHRYEACALVLKWEEIPCRIRDSDDLLSELIMIDENLCRANLTPAQEAYQISRRKEIYEALHPETKAGVAGANGRWNAGDKLSFASDTANQTGKDRRTIERDAARGEALGEDLKLIAGTSLDKGVELDALAKLPQSERDDLMARAQKGEKVSARVRTVDVDEKKERDRNRIDSDVKARAAREVASILSEHVPSEWWDALKANLYTAGASNIATELTNITGEALMDRRFA